MVITIKDSVVLWEEGTDQRLVLKGVSRPGLEYLQTPFLYNETLLYSSIEQDIREMRRWGFNCIRIPLRSSSYVRDQVIQNVVQKIIELSQDMYIILDLHTQRDNPKQDPFLLRDPSNPIRDALFFWKQVAQHYGNQSEKILFELFNEPHDIDVETWWFGNSVYYGYKQVLETVRPYTNRTLCILNGLDYGYQWSFLSTRQDILQEILRYHPIVFSSHPYTYRGIPSEGDPSQTTVIAQKQVFPKTYVGNCTLGVMVPDHVVHQGGDYNETTDEYGWYRSFGFLGQWAPIIITEFGLDRVESALQGGWYMKALLKYFQQKQISYVAWAWIRDRIDYPSIINVDFQPTGFATLPVHGPPCATDSNGWYRGPGFEIYRDLRYINTTLLFSIGISTLLKGVFTYRNM